MMKHPIVFGKYLLLDRVNVGGMAEVYKAKTFGVEGFERMLAIKRILPNMADDEEFINMFVDEARIAVQLSHSNIVQIYELGKFENQYYIAMEYVAGKDMRQILDRMRKQEEILHIPAAAFLISKICDGLDYAHRKMDPSGRPMNVIHRDVSPQNILVSYDGAVKLTDFGIAKAEDRASKTQAGILKGKFGYMSPEQVRGMDIDRRSDIFAVGILLYEMVTGKRLFVGESDFSTLEKVRNADVPPPTEHNENISEELERIMLKALARDRDERYEWASDLHDDLEQFLIEDNSIYNGKKLAAFMREHYGEEITDEASKMEAFARVEAPDALLDLSHPSSVNMRSQRRTNAGPSSATNSEERTMIFESDFDDAKGERTRAAPLGKQSSRHDTGAESQNPVGASQVASRQSMKPEVSVIATPPKGSSAFGKHMPLLMVLGTLCLALMTLLIYLITGDTSHAAGQVRVSTGAVTQVDVFLDGKLVASQTPVDIPDVSLGHHTLTARAAGYTGQPYPFDLHEGETVTAFIELQKSVMKKQIQHVSLIVTSDPAAAEVTINGTKRDETPCTITKLNPTQPLMLKISKEGYDEVSQVLTFAASEIDRGEKTVGYILNKRPPAPVTAFIQVSSTPTGAGIFLGNQKIATTPHRITGLSPKRQYTITIVKTGFERFITTVNLDGKASHTIDAQLVTRTGHSKKTGKAKTKKAVKRKECTGTGSKLGVMALGGHKECHVMVGNHKFPPAPFFNKPAPVGTCQITIVCKDGKGYQITKYLKPGSINKIVVAPDQWQ